MNIQIQIKINEDLELHQIKTEDATTVFYSITANRTYLETWLPFVSYTNHLTDTQQFIDSIVHAPKEHFEYVFTIKQNQEFVGLIGFTKSDYINKKTEIGYWLVKEAQGKGIMTKCVESLCRFAFEELHFNRIQIKCASKNTSSSNIPKRLNFHFEGIERDGELFPDGTFKDLEIYSLLKNEYYL